MNLHFVSTHLKVCSLINHKHSLVYLFCAAATQSCVTLYRHDVKLQGDHKTHRDKTQKPHACFHHIPWWMITKSLHPYSDGPLLVYFKLPVSEISEIDDHKSVSKTLFFIFFISSQFNVLISYYWLFCLGWLEVNARSSAQYFLRSYLGGFAASIQCFISIWALSSDRFNGKRNRAL